MTNQDRVQLEFYYRQKLKDLSLSQLEDYLRLLCKVLDEIEASRKGGTR